MSWPFVKPPDGPPAAGKEHPRGQIHAYYLPFGYPIRLYVWVIAGDEWVKCQLEDITCCHCLWDLKREEVKDG